MKKIDLWKLSLELDGVAMIISGLRNQLDPETSDTLTEGSLDTALFGVENYIHRISNELAGADVRQILGGGAK